MPFVLGRIVRADSWCSCCGKFTKEAVTYIVIMHQGEKKYLLPKCFLGWVKD